MDSSKLKIKYDILLMEINDRFNELLSKHTLIRFYDMDEDEFDDALEHGDHSLTLIGFTNKNGDNDYWFVSEVSKFGIYATDENDSTNSKFKSFNDIDSIYGKIDLIGLMEGWTKENTE